MTREKAIELVNSAFEAWESEYGTGDDDWSEEHEACEMAIKALWQEAILDEIKAEIEEQVLESLSDGGDDWFTAEKVNECLEIIDKYKAESEN